jgi:hypothetical protein
MRFVDLVTILISVSLAACAQLMLKHGMKVAVDAAKQSSGSLVVRAATSPFIVGGLALFGVSAVLWLAALRRVRLELGVGPGYARAEFLAFDRDRRSRFDATDRAVGEMQRLLAADEVTPPPVQAPLPMWLGYQRAEGARRAGRLGVGLLSLDRAAVAAYTSGLEEGGHPPASARVSGLVDIVVSRDPEATFERLLPFAAHQMSTYQRAHGVDATATVEWLRDRGRRATTGVSVLSVDEAVDAITERTTGLPVAHVYCWASVGGMPDDIVDEHLALLLGDVRARVEGGAGT